MDDAQHAEAIEAVKQAIVDGRMYQSTLVGGGRACSMTSHGT